MKKSKLIDVSEFRELIRYRAIHHYWRMPPEYQASIDIDDCTQQVLLFIHRVLNRLDGRKARFDKSKSSINTFVRTAVDRYFQGFSKKFKQKNLACSLVNIDDLHEIVASETEASYILELREARDKVYQLHKRASRDLMVFLDEQLYHNNKGIVTVRGKRFRQLREEFQSKAKEVGCSIDHYRVVLANERRRMGTH